MTCDPFDDRCLRCGRPFESLLLAYGPDLCPECEHAPRAPWWRRLLRLVTGG